ncbi:hypothetical protein EZV62_024679 [Acer yangbiense]|uniref:V-type proton ATPase subunit C n=1 Tax=Acer yangbiense TaxID=1000413 RepID=A0A5C7GVI0_9ROSI|nr:hypothetical protein EZV62_024679 [Acer yangbiense]
MASVGVESSSLTVDGVPVDSYLTRFVWDDSKYPAMSTLREIVDRIHTQVSKIEDDLKLEGETHSWVSFFFFFLPFEASIITVCFGYVFGTGTRIKTRKRNIAAPLDPAAFADAVVQIYLDNAGDLELIAKSIESSDLNFSRYGDTFFEARPLIFHRNLKSIVFYQKSEVAL